MKTKYTNKQKLQRLTTASVLTALSLVLMMTLRFQLFTDFYELEFADVPILICSSLLGPVYALVSLFVVCLIQVITVSNFSGVIGFFMHLLSSGLLVITLSLFNKLSKKYSGIKSVLIRVGASILGVIIVILVMIPMNYWMVSIYSPNITSSLFISQILGVCIAFNAIKAGCNVLIYNVLSPQLFKLYNKLFARG